MLRQFEKLQNAQEEITKCQVNEITKIRICTQKFKFIKENSLGELKKLRQEAQKFTTTELKKLDHIQAKIQEKRAQEATNLSILDGNLHKGKSALETITVHNLF